MSKRSVRYFSDLSVILRRTLDFKFTRRKFAVSTNSHRRGNTERELSYRKQIARQLRTQYVEDIYRPKYYTMTLKSRLRVTQGHWKRTICCIDHTRLTISRVI